MGSVRADVCWLHPDIEVRRSPVHGLGLFAFAPLAPGTTVSRLGGQLISTGELRAMLGQVERAERGYVDSITVAPDRHLVLPAGTPNGRGNHSCDPNTWWIDAYTLAARPSAVRRALTPAVSRTGQPRRRPTAPARPARLAPAGSRPTSRAAAAPADQPLRAPSYGATPSAVTTPPAR